MVSVLNIAPILIFRLCDAIADTVVAVIFMGRLNSPGDDVASMAAIQELEIAYLSHGFVATFSSIVIHEVVVISAESVSLQELPQAKNAPKASSLIMYGISNTFLGSPGIMYGTLIPLLGHQESAG